MSLRSNGLNSQRAYYISARHDQRSNHFLKGLPYSFNTLVHIKCCRHSSVGKYLEFIDSELQKIE